MIKLIIFDFDDTLTDNSRLDLYSFLIPCKKLDLKEPATTMITSLRKKGYLAKDIVKKIIPYTNQQPLYDEFIRIRNEYLESERSLRYLKLQNNTKSLLHILQQKKITCVLSSANKNKDRVLHFLQINNIKKYFSKTYFMDDLCFKIDNSNEENRILIKKSLLHKIIKYRSINHNEIIYVGNSIEDLEAASYFRLAFVHYQNQYLKKLDNYDIIKTDNMKNLKKLIIKQS